MSADAAASSPASTAPASPWLTVAECSKRAKCSPRLIYSAISDGRLRAATLSSSGRGCFRVLDSWLDDFLIASAAPVAVIPARRRA